MRNLCSDKIEEVSWGEDAEAMNAEGTAVMRESGGPAGARRGDCGFREGTAAGARRGGGFTRGTLPMRGRLAQTAIRVPVLNPTVPALHD